MCGIGGFSFCLEATPGKDILYKILDKIKHRGPDDTGIYEDQDNKVGLVHTRLSIQDLSPLGHQPMLGKDGQVALVFNGEIYNFPELRLDLINKGVKFFSRTALLRSFFSLFIEVSPFPSFRSATIYQAYP